MKLFSIEEFSSKRRAAQDRYAALLQPEVTKAQGTGDFDHLVSVAAKLFTQAYADDTDKPLLPSVINDFTDYVSAMLNEHVTAESDPVATALWIASGALNASAVAAVDADDDDLYLEWVDMEDSKVRASHRVAAGQMRQPGELFTVGDAQMPYPGWTGAPISEWINCRCALRPTPAAEVADRIAASLTDLSTVRASLVASDSGDHSADHSVVVVALPSADHEVHGIGDEQKHVTLAYMAEGTPELKQRALDHARSVLAPAAPFTAAVSGHGQLGPAGAKVLFVEAPEIAGMRAALESDEMIGAAVSSGDAHPHFVPHMTIDYGDEMPEEAKSLEQITFDRVAVWNGEDQTEFPLGQPLDEPAEPVEQVAAAIEDPETPAEPAEDAPVAPSTGDLMASISSIPVHGVLAPEGVPSGDGRGFREGSLSNRPLPLPGTWQEKTAEAHDDAAVVFMIEKIQVIDGLQHWSGHLRMTDDADKFLGLMVDFGGRYGLSVDADNAVGEYDEDEEILWFSEARACGAAAVNIPAFHEAYIALGEHPILDAPLDPEASPEDQVEVVAPEPPEGARELSEPLAAALHAISSEGSIEISEELFNDAWERGMIIKVGERDDGAVLYDLNPEVTQPCEKCGMTLTWDATQQEWQAPDGSIGCDEGGSHEVADPGKAMADEGEALVAGGAFLEKAVRQFADLAPGKTEDGPGWLTHPVDTDRLRDYWVHGEGAAKIAWGAPGDFNRCRVNLAEYIKPEFLNGYCANRHYDALHVWPGQEAAAETVVASGEPTAPSISLVAGGGWCAPSEWFDDPKLTKPTGVVITPDGRTYGHIATWGECHIGLPGVCTAPPESLSNYAYFMTGEVPTTDGNRAVGQLTIGGGHADERLGYRGAVAHYDNTCSVWADVAVGQDEFGIWFAGAVRPTATEDMIRAAQASGRLSGDWRWSEQYQNLELMGALSINVGGFPIPNLSLAASGGHQLSLVAAGIVGPSEPSDPGVTGDTEQPEAFDLDALADKLAERLEMRATIKTLRNELEGAAL